MAIEQRFGHRDCLSDDPAEFKAWAENFIQVTGKNQEKWGIPDEAMQGLQMNFAVYLDSLVEDPPPEPDSIDGYTIYWDRQRRFRELLCDFLDVPVGEDGSYDGELLQARMFEGLEGEGIEHWRAYLLNRAQETAARYGMSDAWLEAIRTRVAAVRLPQSAPDESLEGLFFLFSHQR